MPFVLFDRKISAPVTIIAHLTILPGTEHETIVPIDARDAGVLRQLHHARAMRHGARCADLDRALEALDAVLDDRWSVRASEGPPAVLPGAWWV